MSPRTLTWLPAVLIACACSSDPPISTAKPEPELDPRTVQLERGRYLVEHAAICGDCHTPKTADGSKDHARLLSGDDCYVDVVPADPNVGCLSTRNLTNHETGLKNRTDQQIKDMFMKGVRPDGKALHPFMPYPYFANLRAEDADAIVAYLRTVPGVDRTARPSQPPFIPPEQPAPPLDAQLFPMPRAEYGEQVAALRGRYLANSVSLCVNCHTPREQGKIALGKAFQGGMSFPGASMTPKGDYPETIYSSNLTPHATGIAGYAVADVVRALKHGIDREGRGICPPMPAGPKLAFGGLSDRDAQDIAHYVLSLTPVENAVPNGCDVPPPSDSRHAAR